MEQTKTEPEAAVKLEETEEPLLPSEILLFKSQDSASMGTEESEHKDPTW
jgi:hypothetical protein